MVDDLRNVKREDKAFPVGLINVGNTCYFNSLIQTYFAIAPLRCEVLRFPLRAAFSAAHVQQYSVTINFMCELQALFAEMLLTERSACDPSAFLKTVVRRDGAPFATGSQEDVGEFQDFVLTHLAQGIALAERVRSGSDADDASGGGSGGDEQEEGRKLKQIKLNENHQANNVVKEGEGKIVMMKKEEEEKEEEKTTKVENSGEAVSASARDNAENIENEREEGGTAFSPHLSSPLCQTSRIMPASPAANLLSLSSHQTVANEKQMRCAFIQDLFMGDKTQCLSAKEANGEIYTTEIK